MSVRAVLAFLELRLREGVARQLGWIVPLAFVVGWAAASWVPGSDLAARAATADRVAFALIAGLLVLAAAIPAATTLPLELRRGAADGLLASPATRFSVALGSALGHGALASLLAIGAIAATVLGLDAGGLGRGARHEARVFHGVNDVPVDILRASPVATLDVGEPSRDGVVVRLQPRPVNEGGQITRVSALWLTLRAGATSARSRVEFAPGRPFVARFPAGDVPVGEGAATLTIERPDDAWGLHFPPGSIEVGGTQERFLGSALKAALCLIPLLFAASAVGVAAASRLGPPTALAVVLFLGIGFVGQGVLRDGARHVLRQAEIAAAQSAHDPDDGQDHSGHDHSSHDHGRGGVSGLQVALASGALAALAPIPELAVFDRSDALAEARSASAGDIRRAALAAAAVFALGIAAAWGLLARRDLLPL